MIKRSSIVLAGGRGKRLNNLEKALIPLKGSTMIEQIIKVINPLVDEIVISVRDERQQTLIQPYVEDRTIVVDQYHNTGPLAGIMEGLSIVHGEYTFIAACDMPYLNAGVVELLFECSGGHDAALPVGERGIFEPLHAVYRSRLMLVETEKIIKKNERFILAPIFKLKDVVIVDIAKIRQIDPGLRTFININTPEDIEKLDKNR
jgi:molybdopterin-guanine dinucleotide biosynthesis protein A